MDGLENVPIYILGGCFALAFAVELGLNRHPWLVALLTPILGYVGLIIVLSATLGPLTSTDAIMLLLMFLFAPIGSLAGAGAARGLRIWIEFMHEQSRSEN